MFVFIGCAGGGTSSMFCQRIVKASEHSTLKTSFDDLESVMRHEKELAAESDIIFAYGGINAIRPQIVYDFTQLFDVVLIAPQVRFMTKAKKELLADYPIVVKDIDTRLFGLMDGERALDGLLEELITIDIERGYQSKKSVNNKASDKNIDIFVLGGDRKEAFFQSFTNALRNLGLVLLEESYSLEQLYTDHSEKEYDIRFLYGNSALITEEEFPKFARRIDVVLEKPLLYSSFDKKRQWLEDYQIPLLSFDPVAYTRNEGKQELERLLPELLDVSIYTEFSKDFLAPSLEQVTLKKRKKLGWFSWR
ncbi:PTS sugar transporter subunit IIB [Enterococcus wangshanyuanii]|uniref:PTS EIIB type-3 domain-containing protein n=1 Tax=Enterococcus wangshanyuanii TaxID=2005703 RepID=A0ABQ1PC19_9ENTE|nr:hypothetical protein [Enterococcus wangshanyuanii]GGC94286.1 hypothetical protein GCM10011573_24930 [Enterococcus wangshanyuanii]